MTITWHLPTVTPAAALEARVAAALESDAASAADLHGLIAEVSAALSDTRERSLRAAERARDFRLTRDDAQAALDDEAALLFTAARYESALAALQTAHQAAQKREVVQARRTEQEALTAARDALAVELAERYPALAFELSELLSRCQACDDRIAEFVRVNRTHIDGVEVVARGLATAGLDSIQRLIPAVRLPSWDPKRQGMNVNIWPPAQQAGAAVPLGMQQRAAELGHEARATGEVVARMRVAEIGSPRRRIA